MEIVLAALGVDVGIAGVFLFGALVVRRQSASTALLFCEPHDCVLGDVITPSCFVEKLKVVLPPKGIGVFPASACVSKTA